MHQFFLFFILLFLTHCGQSPKSTVDSEKDTPRTSPPVKKTPTVGSPNYSTGTGTNYSSGTSYTSNPATQSCPNEQRANQLLINACRPSIRDNSDVLSSPCVNAAEALSNFNCSGMASRISQAVSACAPEIQRYRQYVPSACLQALNS